MVPKTTLSAQTLEERLQELLKQAETAPITLGKMLEILAGRGRALILMFLSIPFCQPLQIPGLSMPFGFVIALVGMRMTFNKSTWLPHCIKSISINASTLQNIISKMLILLKKMRFLIHPRMHWACRHPIAMIVNGILITLLGIFLALPLPLPLSNIVAAWPIFLIALGLLEDDGLFVLLGYLIVFIALLILALIIFEISKL